jgi:hypothetical protein
MDQLHALSKIWPNVPEGWCERSHQQAEDMTAPTIKRKLQNNP